MSRAAGASLVEGGLKRWKSASEPEKRLSPYRGSTLGPRKETGSQTRGSREGVRGAGLEEGPERAAYYVSREPPRRDRAGPRRREEAEWNWVRALLAAAAVGPKAAFGGAL